MGDKTDNNIVLIYNKSVDYKSHIQSYLDDIHDQVEIEIIRLVVKDGARIKTIVKVSNLVKNGKLEAFLKTKDKYLEEFLDKQKEDFKFFYSESKNKMYLIHKELKDYNQAIIKAFDELDTKEDIIYTRFLDLVQEWKPNTLCLDYMKLSYDQTPINDDIILDRDVKFTDDKIKFIGLLKPLSIKDSDIKTLLDFYSSKYKTIDKALEGYFKYSQLENITNAKWTSLYSNLGNHLDYFFVLFTKTALQNSILKKYLSLSEIILQQGETIISNQTTLNAFCFGRKAALDDINYLCDKIKDKSSDLRVNDYPLKNVLYFHFLLNATRLSNIQASSDYGTLTKKLRQFIDDPIPEVSDEEIEETCKIFLNPFDEYINKVFKFWETKRPDNHEYELNIYETSNRRKYTPCPCAIDENVRLVYKLLDMNSSFREYTELYLLHRIGHDLQKTIDFYKRSNTTQNLGTQLGADMFAGFYAGHRNGFNLDIDTGIKPRLSFFDIRKGPDEPETFLQTEIPKGTALQRKNAYMLGALLAKEDNFQSITEDTKKELSEILKNILISNFMLTRLKTYQKQDNLKLVNQLKEKVEQK